MRASFLALVALLAACALPVLAEDGTLTLEIHEALADVLGADDWTNPPQDFYVIHRLEGQQFRTREIGGRDHASWSPPETNTITVPGKNQRFFTIELELWDNDTCCFGNAPDIFDIDPESAPRPQGNVPVIQYDVCTGALELFSPYRLLGYHAASVHGEGAPGDPASPDFMNYHGTVRFAVRQEPGTWLPDDVAVVKVSPVQAVFDPAKIVELKATSLLVEIASSYPAPIVAPVTAQISDGWSVAVDSRVVTIQPGRTRVILFDGTNAPPYYPEKLPAVGNGTLNASATVQYSETVSPNAPRRCGTARTSTTRGTPPSCRSCARRTRRCATCASTTWRTRTRSGGARTRDGMPPRRPSVSRPGRWRA